MDGKNNSSFWPSYVDIMTTLFAIMLVLFVVSFSRFKVKEKQLRVLVDEYENIVNVYKTVNEIDQTGAFRYDPSYLKHLMNIEIKYQPKEYSMYKLADDTSNPSKADEIRAEVKADGYIIKEKINKLEMSIPDSLKKNIKFLIVIEGQSSKIPFNEGDWRNNYTLSYLRAQFLNKFWIEQGIDFDKMPRCELLISGSGEAGKPRVKVNEDSLRRAHPNKAEYLRNWVKEEEKNQRFLVNIVPVIGNIDFTKEKMDNLKGKN